MLKAFKKLWNSERGNALIMFGAALPLLVGAAGLAADTIQWTLWKRQLQRAADSGAIAGVYTRIKTDTQDAVAASV
ncbi:MAG TPA: pilus assembly protein TadG-related protein, partial [Sphingomicrobium sp.]|nr:pilus assembly protein TadG-related protein [Sphingomicrobium sp.]